MRYISKIIGGKPPAYAISTNWVRIIVVIRNFIIFMQFIQNMIALQGGPPVEVIGFFAVLGLILLGKILWDKMIKLAGYMISATIGIVAFIFGMGLLVWVLTLVGAI